MLFRVNKKKNGAVFHHNISKPALTATQKVMGDCASVRMVREGLPDKVAITMQSRRVSHGEEWFLNTAQRTHCFRIIGVDLANA